LGLIESFAYLGDFFANVVLSFALFYPLLLRTLVVQLYLPQASLCHLFLFTLSFLPEPYLLLCLFLFELCQCLFLLLLLLKFGLEGVPAA
jgi:hypothetical protein